MSPEFEELRREHDAAGIGPKLAELLARVVRATAAVYPAGQYSDSPNWTTEALEDLLHDWISERLVGRGDLAAIMAMAGTMGVLRASLTTSFSQFLINRRRRSSASNLFKRVERMLEDHRDFAPVGRAPKAADQEWTLASLARDVRSSPLSLGALVAIGFERTDQDLEVIRYGPASLKSSPILRQPQLKRMLIYILERASGSLSLARIADVLNRRFNLIDTPVTYLTPMLESVGPGPLRRVERADSARHVVARLGQARLEVLRMVHQTGTVSGAARSLDISPSTLAKRLKEAMAIIGESAESLEEAHEIYQLIAESLF